jgi:hypothetical protein
VRALVLAAAAALALVGCGDLAGLVTVNQAAIQEKVEAMTGMPPAEQCSVYFLAKQYAPAEIVAEAEAIIEGQGFVCAPPVAAQ